MKTIPYGHRWPNGMVLNDCHTDVYNSLSEEMQEWEERPSSLRKIESLKTARHYFLCHCFHAYKQKDVEGYLERLPQ